ncbi:MAG: LPXTG cell wall anchor domain-containing protein, partial [Chloroflexi bacterium]|nr:LPXTG cell wall anchor domain-containing protein [Chloroflexota bacterium]
MMEADGMVQGAGAVPEDQQTFAMDAASAGEPEVAPMQPVPAPPVQATQPENAAEAMREHDEQSGLPTGEQPDGRIDNEASVTPENQTTETIPLSPEAADMVTVPTVSTAAEVAQEPPGSTETQPQSQRQAKQPDQGQNNWWLVGAGLLMLFVSIAVFLIGRKKARSA